MKKVTFVFLISYLLFISSSASSVHGVFQNGSRDLANDTVQDSLTLERPLLVTSKSFLPVIYQLPVIEETPYYRWPHEQGGLTYVTYYWGNYLLDHNNPWRQSITSSIVSWNDVTTGINYLWDDSGMVKMDLEYNDADLAPSGRSFWVYDPNSGILFEADVYLNSYYSNYSENSRKSVASHELGHGLSLNHILNPEISIMGNNPNNELFFVPQLLDILLVNYRYQ